MTRHRRGLRAAIYARSAATGLEDSEGQLNRCRAFATANGLEVVAAYQDDNCSGLGTGDRPGLQALRATAAGWLFDILIITDFSRLSRSPAALADLLMGLADVAVEVLVIDGSYEPYISVATIAEMLPGRRG